MCVRACACVRAYACVCACAASSRLLLLYTFFDVYFHIQSQVAVCGRDCLMKPLQTCKRFQCLYNHSAFNTVPIFPTSTDYSHVSTNLGASYIESYSDYNASTAYYSGKISVECAKHYATFDGLQSCNRKFSATCQADGRFTNTDRCLQASCDPYVTIDPYIHADSMTLGRTLAGNIITMQCKKNYTHGHGYGFNTTFLDTSHYVVRGAELSLNLHCGLTKGCMWDEAKTCERVPCKCMRYSQFVKTMLPRNDDELTPILEIGRAHV